MYDFCFQSHLNQRESSQKDQGGGYAKWNHVFSTEYIYQNKQNSLNLVFLAIYSNLSQSLHVLLFLMLIVSIFDNTHKAAFPFKFEFAYKKITFKFYRNILERNIHLLEKHVTHLLLKSMYIKA